MAWYDSLKSLIPNNNGLEEIDMTAIPLKLDSFGNPIPGTGGQAFAPPMQGGLFGGMLDQVDPRTGVVNKGWGGLALNTAQALGSGWMAMKQYGMAKDQFDFQKNMMKKNYEAQKNLTNSQLADRQRARIAATPGNYWESEADYMAKYGVK